MLSANALRVLEARYLLRDRERRLIETPAQRPDAGVFRETKIPEGARVVDADCRESH